MFCTDIDQMYQQSSEKLQAHHFNMNRPSSTEPDRAAARQRIAGKVEEMLGKWRS